MPQIDQVAGFILECRKVRTGIKTIAIDVKSLHDHSLEGYAGIGQDGIDEVHANITLAYRHLEDAAMRLGKAIQAFDGGKSVYDDARTRIAGH